MWRATVFAAALVASCGSPAVQQQDRRTLPDPLVAANLPGEVERPGDGVRTAPVVASQAADGSEVGAGILFDTETAVYVGRLRLGYDELRSLYLIDLRTWGRERTVYERLLTLADDEILRLHGIAERSWLEDNGGILGLVVGIVVGMGATIGIAAALDAALASSSGGTGP